MAGQNGRELIVDVRDVVKKFIVGNTEITILKGLSFQVYSGEFVMIVGPSGNGKSTLLNMCTGIDFPNSGQVLVTGQDIHEMNANRQSLWRGSNVGIIFQFFQMMPSLTLFSNVMLPMELAGKYTRKERKDRAEYLLEMVDLKEQMHKLPGMVSGGQQQRAAISRAMANDPPLLIADEPTGNLDPTSARMVFEIFQKLVSEGKTIMMVTHDKGLAAQVSRQIEIVNGRITKDDYRHRRDWAGG
jgi:putative ABC transport system ATP-binding protein